MTTVSKDFEEAGISAGNAILKCKNYSLSVRVFGVLIYLSVFIFLFLLLNNMLNLYAY
jgi:hypothetical protein